MRLSPKKIVVIMPISFSAVNPSTSKLKNGLGSGKLKTIIAILSFAGFAIVAEPVHADIMYVAGVGNLVTEQAEPGFEGVEKISSTGTDQSTIAAGTGADAIAFDNSGNLYVAENAENRIEKFSSTGADLGTFAVTASSTPQQGGNGDVLSMAFDSSGNLYVADDVANAIEEFSPTGTLLNTITSPGVLQPTSIAFDSSGNLYVAQYGYYWIERFSSTGVDLGAFASTGTSNTNGAFSIAFDSAGNMYVAYLYSDTIEKFSPTGVDLGVFAKELPGSEPIGLAFDSAGNLYVSNFIGYIEKFSSTGADLGTFASGSVSAGERDIAFTNDAGVPLALPPAVPEPSTLVLGLTGFAGLAGVLLIRRRKA